MSLTAFSAANDVKTEPTLTRNVAPSISPQHHSFIGPKFYALQFIKNHISATYFL